MDYQARKSHFTSGTGPASHILLVEEVKKINIVQDIKKGYSHSVDFLGAGGIKTADTDQSTGGDSS